MAKGKYEYWLTEDGLTLLQGWARDGLTDEQIARRIGISAKTLYTWKNNFGKICNALKKGKEVVDIEVENALLKRAKGFDYTEETKERIFNHESGEFELVVTKSVRKHAAPDPVAAFFWLKNRKPEAWREKGQEAARVDDGVEVINDAPPG